MKKTFCDKCGCEITGFRSPFHLDFKIKKILWHANVPNDEIKIHLCNSCCVKLNEWIGEKDEIH